MFTIFYHNVVDISMNFLYKNEIYQFGIYFEMTNAVKSEKALKKVA